MNNRNTSHPNATIAELCLWVAVLYAIGGCLMIGYSASAGATPENVLLNAYKIWGLKTAFTGGLYMVFAPIVRFMYMHYLWKHHFVLMSIGFIILMNTSGSLGDTGEFGSPMTLLIIASPFLAVLFLLKVRPLPRKDR